MSKKEFMNEKLVEFEFDLEQKVKTKFGDKGFVELLGVNDGGLIYFVQINIETGRWFRSWEIEAIEDQC